MTAQLTLNDEYTAITEPSRYPNFKPDVPVIVLLQNGLRTPGQWYADTIADRVPDGPLYIDFGANWKIDANAHALLYGFAVGVLVQAGLR